MTGVFLLQVFVWSLTIYGITQIVTEATIFEWFRVWLKTGTNAVRHFLSKLVSCFLCTSVWISGLLSVWIFSPSSILWPDVSVFESAFIDAMFGSTIVWFMHLYENKIG